MARHWGTFLRIQGFTMDLYRPLSPISLHVNLQLRLNLSPQFSRQLDLQLSGKRILYTKMHLLFQAAIPLSPDPTRNLVATQGLIQRLWERLFLTFNELRSEFFQENVLCANHLPGLTRPAGMLCHGCTGHTRNGNSNVFYSLLLLWPALLRWQLPRIPPITCQHDLKLIRPCGGGN